MTERGRRAEGVEAGALGGQQWAQAAGPWGPRPQAWNSLANSGCPVSVCLGVSAGSGRAFAAFTRLVGLCDLYTVCKHYFN